MAMVTVEGLSKIYNIAVKDAGIVGTFIPHPLDTVKVRYQVSRSDKITLRKFISDIYRYGGVSN